MKKRSFWRYVWMSLKRGTAWESALRWMRARGAPVPMSWEAYRFDRYQRMRWQGLPAQDLAGVRCGELLGLVSVVLPAYNGAGLVRQALDSVLAQTYDHWEMVAVDDGSTDGTGAILDEYAQAEPRIRVIHQANQKLPRALNAGFAAARGEFLTWISCDNRMHLDFLEKMVGALQARPDWEAAYANLDLIGEDGEPLRTSAEYLTYQSPYGSEHIHLPVHASELNVLANNTVGAAFMYRRRAMCLVGEYSPRLYTVEDYDFWMRVNELLYLKHAPFAEPVYDYRFHGGSLTSRSAELKIKQVTQELMVWDDFRRDFNLVPCLWWVRGESETAEAVRKVLRSSPLSIVMDVEPGALRLPDVGLPVVRIKVEGGGMKVEGWEDEIVITGTDAERGGREPTRSVGTRRRWIEVPDVRRGYTVVDILARRYALEKMDALLRPAETAAPGTAGLKATVVVCTHRRVKGLAGCLQSVAELEFPAEAMEVIVVNNARPGSEEHAALRAALEGARQAHFEAWGERFRWLDCPVPGLSAARNAALWAARGEVACFLDDDALAEPDWLTRIWEAFDAHAEAGVVGGAILLREPEIKPWWYRASWKRFWSHFEPRDTEMTAVDGWENFPWGANWAARVQPLREVGGFRARFGRQGSSLMGGEEIAAASLIQKLGYRVMIAPQAVVHHHVDAERFTWQYVWRNIRANRRTWYGLQKEGYVAWDLGWKNAWRRIAEALRHVGSESPFKPFFTLSAEVTAAGWQLGDLLRRMRRPWRGR